MNKPNTEHYKQAMMELIEENANRLFTNREINKRAIVISNCISGTSLDRKYSYTDSNLKGL